MVALHTTAEEGNCRESHRVLQKKVKLEYNIERSA
jgi:hypothetical protein